nr:AAA family ATPase [uncultured Devosia sp.]
MSDRLMEQEADDDQQSRPFVSSARARATFRSLPIFMLHRVLGSQLKRFTEEQGLCVLIRVKSESWIAPCRAGARLMCEWSSVLDDFTGRNRDTLIADALDYLARGGRVLVVVSKNTAVPAALKAAVDIELDVDTITRDDVARAIKQTTERWPRGLSDEDIDGLELPAAVSAIRAKTSAASCIRRLRNAKTVVPVDALVADAPELSQLHGYGEAAVWAQRLIDDLALWRDGKLEFSAIQKNAVLAGPPGVGKSTFMRSLAKSTSLPLVVSSVGTMFATSPGYLDSVVKAIDAVFATANAAGQTAILFLDELDGFPDRATLDQRSASWWTPVVNHLLTCLDSALGGSAGKLIVVGATNHPHNLDAALVRPGRFDRILNIELPDLDDLAGIFRQHLGADLIGEDLAGIASIAAGRTGAEVADCVKGARARARRNGRPVEVGDLVEQLCPPSKFSEADIWRTCVHESGHVVAATLLDVGELLSASVTGAYAGQGGQTVLRRSQAMTTAERTKRLVVHLLSGRAAEEVLLGSVAGGAGGAPDSDLGLASHLVAAGHLSFGLGGFLTYVSDPEESLVVARRSPEVMNLIETEMRALYAQAKTLVEDNREAVQRVAEALRTHRVLGGADLKRIAAGERRRGGLRV